MKKMKWKSRIIIYMLILGVAFIGSLGVGKEVEAYYYDEDNRIYECGDFEYLIDESTGYAKITKYTGGERVIVVPAELDGVRVGFIADLSDGIYKSSFCKKVKKVVLPEGLVYVGGMRDFVSLKEVNIPSTVTQIGYNAFRGCRKLSKIELPEGLETIGNSAFYECRSLKKVKLPNSVTTIEEGGFADCTSLKEINFPNGLGEIGDFAFYGCTSLKTVLLPDSVSELGWEVFYGCEKLSKVKLPDELDTIPQDAFCGCYNLKSIVLPKQLETIEESAFERTGLKEITIPKNVTTIDWYAFSYNTKLKKVIIKSKKIDTIGKGAFKNVHAKVVFDVPDKYITKYKKLLIKSKSIQKNKFKIK